MRQIRGFVFLLASWPLCFSGVIPQAEYRSRRAEFRKNLDGTLVLFGRVEGRDEVFTPRQDPDFYYLTGWTEPGAVLLMTPDSETFFLPKRTQRIEYFNGRRADAQDEDAPARTGFDRVLPVEKLEPALLEAIGRNQKVYSKIADALVQKMQRLLAMREIVPAAPLVAALRMKKSPAEIAAITHATNVSMDAHRAAWKRIRGGAYEYQAGAAFLSTLLEAGCEGPSYAPIFGSGPNSTVLHYSANKRRMDSGELIVIDAAAECEGYASDITRTLPVGGRFTPRQKQIYGYVLAAQKAVIAQIKPGVKVADLTGVARNYFNQFKDEAGEPLGKYLWHGVSHHVGLDVHDASVPEALEAGMVITVEPGLYFPKESLGVRIEDTILVTKDGAKVLSAALPKEPDEVEKALAR